MDDLRAPRGRRHVLLVIADKTVQTHPLPDDGDVLIGRSPQNDVPIDDPSISRRHAVLHVRPGKVTVEDLGSANGTRIADAKLFTPQASDMARTAELLDRRVEPGLPVPVTPDTVIKLGSATLVVQSATSGSRPRRLWPHGNFEMFLEEECARAERSRGAFAVLRVQVEDAPKGIPEEVLAECTRTVDLVASYGPGEYEVLLIDAARDKAEEARRRIVAGFVDRGVVARVGLAHHPEDGRTPETLLFRANARLGGEEPPREGKASKGAAPGDDGFVVLDPTMVRLYGLVERIADSTISVLVLGETGVGKEILAETIHRRSGRSAQPFVKLNCAALSESLLESELFGHERGAFTGAVQAKAGLLESAHGGTVFLDEVGEISPAIQVKLLRVLEERKVTRVGSLKPKDIDVRFVAATNRDLEAEVAAGTFREDLFFRLAGIPLVIPPLRERPVEIEPLARALVAQTSRKNGRSVPELRRDAVELLRRYTWPGNIRELRNVMERAALLSGGGPIGPEHLPVEKMVGAALPARMNGRSLPPAPSPRTAPAAPPAVGSRRPLEPPDEPLRPTVPPGGPIDADATAAPLRSGVEQAERDLILRALEQCAGNQTQAAKLLGISRRTLVSRLEQYQLPRPRKGF